MSKRFSALVLALAGLLLVTVAPARADTTVTAQLQEANDSGVTRHRDVDRHRQRRADGSSSRARGHVPGVPHAQHIHGSTSGGHFMCPTMETTPTATVS